MIILNALKPDIYTLNNKIQDYLKNRNIYYTYYESRTGNIEIADLDKDFVCNIIIKPDFNEVEITSNIPDAFTEEVINGIIIPSFIDIDIQQASDKIKMILKANDNGVRYIPTGLRYENNEYFLMTTLEKGQQNYEFKITINKIDGTFKLHAVPFYQYPNDEEKYISDYIIDVQNSINKYGVK